MKTRILFFVMILFITTSSLFGQTAGDYGSAGTANWGTTGANWLVFVSAADWSDATAAPGAPSSSINVWIRSGHTVTVDASSKVCKNLTVVSGATLLTSATGNTLTVNGDALIDGTLGSVTVGPLFQFAASGKIYGSGTCYVSKIRANADGVTMTVDMDAAIISGASSVINCNNRNNIVFELKSGRTLTLPTGGYISIASNSSTSDPGAGQNFTINIYGTLNVPIASGGGISLGNLTGFTTTLNVYSGGVVNAGRISAIAAGTADPGALNVNIYSGGSVTIEGGASAATNDMTKATLNIEGSFTTGSNLTSTLTIGNLTLNNSAGITLLSPTIVTGTLTLTSGKITTTASNLLTLGSAGSVSGGSASSFIDGPLAHTIASTSLTTKTFPVGKGLAYRPVELAITQGAATSTTYTAEVFNAAPVSNTIPGTLGNTLSTVRYWSIVGNPSTAITSSTVQLTYGADDGVTDNENLRIAQGPAAGGGAWENLLGSGTANTSGTITSSAALTDYSTNTVYTLANSTTGTNPLPVELKSFIASVKEKSVELLWNTATEINNAGFEIERAEVRTQKSEVRWSKIGFIEGNGTTNAPQTYRFVDNVTAATTYQYRLKQIDRDGQFEYSPTVEAIVALTAQDYQLSQNYPNPFNPSTTFTFAMKNEEHTTVKVFNLIGQEVATLFNDIAKPNQLYTMTFDAKNLSSGVYFYSLQSNSRREIKKMLFNK